MALLRGWLTVRPGVRVLPQRPDESLDMACLPEEVCTIGLNAVASLLLVVYLAACSVHEARGGCELTLDTALQAALDATGTGTCVTCLMIRPYG
jgi:hypothetical protein